MTSSAGQRLVEALVSLGADHFYTVPGESFLEVLEGARAHPEARLVSTRQEGGAAFMAEADAKLRGRPGVAMATRAPGAANLAIGVHTAWHDSTPLVALLGQVESRLAGSGLCFQEIDLEAMYRPFTKWTATLERAEQASELAREAVRLATSGRPGPVMVALPADVLGEPAPAGLPAPLLPAPPPPGLGAAVEVLAARLAGARLPVCVVGGRCSGLWPDLVRLAEAYGLGVYSAFRRQDQFPNDHPSYLGHLSLAPPEAMLAPLAAADLVLALGCRMSEVTTQRFRFPGREAYFAHVDGDAGESPYRPGREPDLAVAASPAPVVAALLGRHQGPPAGRDWAPSHAVYEADSSPPATSTRHLIQPEEVVAAMVRVLPEDAIVTNDAGNFSIPLHRQWRFRAPHSQLAPTSGAMGYAVPAAVAAGLVRPERLAVAVVGDGGYLMTGQEVETAVRIGSKVVVVAVRNGLYGTIAMHQARTFGELSGVEIGEADLARHAESLGALGLSVRERSELEPALAAAAAAPGPAVVDVVVDPEAITPSARLSELQEATRARGPRG